MCIRDSYNIFALAAILKFGARKFTQTLARINFFIKRWSIRGGSHIRIQKGRTLDAPLPLRVHDRMSSARASILRVYVQWRERETNKMPSWRRRGLQFGAASKYFAEEISRDAAKWRKIDGVLFHTRVGVKRVIFFQKFAEMTRNLMRTENRREGSISNCCSRVSDFLAGFRLETSFWICRI